MAETKDQILRNIKDNFNKYTAFEVKMFLENNIISESELLKAVEGDTEIVEAIKNFYNPLLENTPEIPVLIKDNCTEIYFWGLASAGKTWALVGIMNTILTEGYLKLYGKNDREQCISSEYLNGLLSVIKKRPINYFPNKTTNDTLRYMNFKLMKNGEERKVAFIDLCGDVIEAIAKENYAKNHKDQLAERNLLYKLLENKNRKIHFFFIDYAHNDEKDGSQHVLFNHLGAIFNSKHYFKNTTDFIYIVITKADMIDENDNVRHNKAVKYFNENYKAFRNNIGKICQENEINYGDTKKLGDYSFLDNYILDFSMGEVLFLRMCRFNKKSSLKIVDVLQEKVQKERTGIRSIFG